MRNRERKCIIVITEEGQFDLTAHIQLIGKDILVSIFGGDVPHIGAVAMAQPRPSLKDPEKTSSTSSVFTYIGHKEDELAKASAETLAARFNTNVVVTAGIHWNDLTPGELKSVIRNSKILNDRIIESIEAKSER